MSWSSAMPTAACNSRRRNVNAVEQQLPRPKSLGRIAVADDGRVWLFFRHHPLPGGTARDMGRVRHELRRQGMEQADHAFRFRRHHGQSPRPRAVVALAECWRYTAATGGSAARTMWTAHGRLPLKTDLYAALLQSPGPVVAPELAAAEPGSRHVEPVHPHEGEDIQQLRDLRVEVGGKTYRLARGEFHRHTEYTAHRDGDSSLEDMWRYAQDAADMDWLGNGDHDNGFGHQYPWWITQKTMDIYHNPPYFIAPYTYERSVVWPNGHRNVIFTERGIRTLPRGKLPGDPKTGSPDTKMLYAYLHQFHGICASHTSATNMGTDWRDNDPGGRAGRGDLPGRPQQLRVRGRPRGLTPQRGRRHEETSRSDPQPGLRVECAGQRVPVGLRKLQRPRQHAYAATRFCWSQSRRGKSIVEAFKARRCYAATDNIGLVVKCGDHLMGEEFTLSASRRWKSRLSAPRRSANWTSCATTASSIAASPIARTSRCNGPTPIRPADPVSYYYVRVQQADGNLAWCSPMWIHPK